MPKTIVYKDESGEKYKISYSEKLQEKNLRASRAQIRWQRRNFYAKVLLILILGLLTATIIYTLFKLDQINFFTQVAFR